jgi:hypothetical protein
MWSGTISFGFHAVAFNIDARYDINGVPVGLGADDPATSLEPFHNRTRSMLTHAATLE